MARFTLVENGVWDDAAFMELGSDARLVFLWSWTNRQAAICGLYSVSLRALGRALPPSPEWPETEARIVAALDELAAKPLVVYDYDAEVVWVVNRVVHANRSPKVTTAIRREFDACPPSPLREQFRDRYGAILNPARGEAA